MFPVLAAVISNFLIESLSVQQWLGIAMAGGGLILVSWK
jgi:drug/metabolite transporter (DMT)-like permease